MCTHEEIAVAIAKTLCARHRRDQADGLAQHRRPAACPVMAIFNAWCDRTPIPISRRRGRQDTTNRRSTDWVHTANVQGLAVREFVEIR